jgi:hypothetical protein
MTAVMVYAKIARFKSEKWNGVGKHNERGISYSNSNAKRRLLGTNRFENWGIFNRGRKAQPRFSHAKKFFYYHVTYK